MQLSLCDAHPAHWATWSKLSSLHDVEQSCATAIFVVDVDMARIGRSRSRAAVVAVQRRAVIPCIDYHVRRIWPTTTTTTNRSMCAAETARDEPSHERKIRRSGFFDRVMSICLFVNHFADSVCHCCITPIITLVFRKHHHTDQHFVIISQRLVLGWLIRSLN